MKKLFLKGLLICLMACLLGVSAYAESGSCGDNVRWTLENGVLTISGSGEMTEYDEIDAVPWREMKEDVTEAIVEEGITYIGRWCFYDMDNLISVSLPSTLKSTGSAVFHDCGSLEELIFPEGMEELGYMSASECDKLTYISIPSTLTKLDGENFTSLPELLCIDVAPGNEMFIFQNNLLIDKTTMTLISGAAAVGTVEIPQGIEYIGDYAFMCNPYITDVIVPEGVREIGGMAFYRCEWLTTAYLPESLGDLGMYAFHRSESITDIYYAGTVSQWNSIKFPSTGDESLQVVESVLHYETPVPAVNSYVGQADTAEQTAEIPNAVEDSGGWMLEMLDDGVCGDNLTWEIMGWSDSSTGESGAYLDILGTGDMWDYTPEDPAPWAYSAVFDQVSVSGEVTSIGDYAFYDCDAVEVVFICESLTGAGASLARLGAGCFEACDGLESIFYEDTLEQWQQVSVGENNDVLLSKLCYYVPEEDRYYALESAGQTEDQMATADVSTTPVIDQNDGVAASQTVETAWSPMMILIIVALVVLVIAIGTSTTVIIMVLRRNKQAQNTPPAASPQTPEQTYGFTQNSRYDPHSQYHTDEK